MAAFYSEEKVKPFRLVKYFTFISLIVIFIGAIALAILNTHWARKLQRQKSEDYALLLVENLNHQIFLQFVIPVALKFGQIQLREPEQFERMDRVVRATLHSFKIDQVNIYDLGNTVSYSFDRELVGQKYLGGTGFHNAAAGRTSSKLLQRGNFIEIMLGIPKDIELVTFAPLRAEKPMSSISGPVLGVLEIVQDLSEDYRTIFNFQIYVIASSTLVMGLLLLTLIYVVKRGENIIHLRNLERMRLKEKLERARHLSALGELTAGISHEIRNPLGIIRSSAEHLKKKMAALDPTNAIPDIIIEEANRLNNIITDFLNFAKPKTPHLVPCRVDEIVDKNLTYLAAQIQEKQYTVTKFRTENIPEILADVDMLYQAFLNILLNAMQAMPEGGEIEIDISRNGGHVEIRFEDEGPGIPENLLEKIWDPFFTTKETGTGLGLGLVKNIIEAHAGTITLQNKSQELGQGSRVVITLPMQALPAAESP